MKKALLLFATVFCVCTIFAQTHRLRKVKVSDFQFLPATFNAKVGDTVLWIWQNGGHTTTSTSVPLNAKTWNSPINSTHKRFRYIIRKAGTYQYECSIHSFSMKGTITVTAALTAGLSDIEITPDNAGAVLNWHVNSNADVTSFSVQRSTDGNKFTEVARVQPSALTAYKYKDEALLTSKYVYYQVEMTDKKGNKELSAIAMFTNAQNSTKLITSINPNPISSPGHLMMQFNADADGKMKVQLFTQAGKLVTETEMTAVKGLNNGHLHLGALTPGEYYILCTLGNKTEKHIVVYQ